MASRRIFTTSSLKLDSSTSKSGLRTCTSAIRCYIWLDECLPKSTFHGFKPPLPVVTEAVALKALIEFVKKQDGLAGKDFVEFELERFTFYVNTAYYPFEMRPLQHLATKLAHDTLYLDGVLRIGDVRQYVTRVEVSELPIGNYGMSHPTVAGEIWVRSKLNAKKEIYYRLKKPAPEYVRFYNPFLWVVDLAKHFVDFCSYMIEARQQVSLGSFRELFMQRLLQTHKKSPSFQVWRRAHPGNDFRTSIVANVEFLWKEANGVFENGEATALQVFREIRQFTQYPINKSPSPLHIVSGGESASPTIVTPRSCAVDPSRQAMIRGIAAGDTISTPRDGDSTDTKWARVTSMDANDDSRWFGLVQKVHINERTGARSFDVTWFYRPVETPCCLMKYPWPNELFLSDHCTCEEGRDARVKEEEVLATHPVDWFGNPNGSGGNFFVRQTYIVENRRWITLENSHLRCSHGQERLGFASGDTVLAAISRSDQYTEPYEVIKVFRQGLKRFVRLRRLRRRRQVDPQATRTAPNELVYTDELVVINAEKISMMGKLEAHEGAQRCVPLRGDFPTSLRQGFDPQRGGFEKLKGLDLFCGGGNFGRGLEDGGVVKMCWANDIWDKAIHTYMANAPDPEKTHPFLGSVDDLLQQALEGKFAANVPRPGEVDFISAGSPCPGFSLLTKDKTTLSQIKNQSLVASFAAFVDFYRPKYGVLENVTSIVQARHNRKEDVLSQLFCAVVGMGYQAQLILGDAWSHGTPQSRSRVFLYFAAPGLRLPEAPTRSHSHFPSVKSRGLGELCTQEPFVRRSFEPTPFKYCSAGESIGDLPSIYDAKADCCVAFPDHRVAAGVTNLIRHQIAAIPTHPYGMNFSKAWEGGRGVMTPGERDLFPFHSQRTTPISKGWGRVRPQDPFSTVTTRSAPTDARTGSSLHWHDDRPVTVMEVRRAQGFLDHEVILGNCVEQWRIVGNSVARQMAVALGLQFRKAWLGSLYDASCDEVSIPLEAFVGDLKLPKGVQDWSYDKISDTTASHSPSPSDTDGALGRSEMTPITISSTECATEREKVIESRGRKRLLSLPAHIEVYSKRLAQDEEPTQTALGQTIVRISIGEEST
ncbi:S-adenosyl-L-methionine-dependent methyltransferase [Podospora didyma]|uniref:DNA (cytosine-5-)-methyltransferase n=1 Tax=Podospora didyma TaxID=330526 RepID=A0AAE0NNV9_9PEZI|nr:S-adenosyl-L-methionine-dependent methyltransferase [Podospora didyma]